MKGFTLLEVLVALSVLAIVMLGIYSVLDRSVTTTTYAQDRHYTVNKGYERILRHMHYPRISLSATEEDDDGVEMEFEYNRKNTPVPGVRNVQLRVKTKNAVTGYEFFERGM